MNDLEINVDDLKPIRILDPLGVLRDGYLLISPKPDKSGLVGILDPRQNSIFKIHPKRIEEVIADGSLAIISDGQAIAACPACGDICKVDDGDGECVCGNFRIKNEIGDEKVARITKKKQTAVVDFLALAANGELWLKTGLPFDSDAEVTAVSYRIGDRYLSFNLYNKSFGKRGNNPVKELEAGKNVGYKVKNIDKWREKLQNKGYEHFTE